MENNNKKLTTVLIIYSVLLYAAWAVYELLIVPYYKAGAGETLFRILDSAVVKTAVWTVPAFLLIMHFNADVSVPVREMFSFRRGWKTLLTALVPMTAYILLVAWKTKGGISISGQIPVNTLIFLFVGFNEEMVFRGWLFNATVREDSPWPAYALNAVMFVLIHFPKWIADGVLLTNILSAGFIIIAMLSVLFAWTFRKTRNILVPAFLHFWWDLLITLLT